MGRERRRRSKLLMQLVFPTSGRAEILGHPVGDVATRRRIGYLAENPYYYDYLTAEELLDYFAKLFGYSSADRRRARGGSAGSRRHRRRAPACSSASFPKGMVQRVGIAQALLNDPEVVFFDEPMSGLDPLGRRDVRALILELRDQGRTVFFSSHILADAQALCSRVAVVAGGRLAATGSLNEILAFDVRGWELVMTGVTARRNRKAAAGATPRDTDLAGTLFARAFDRPSARTRRWPTSRRRAQVSCRSIRCTTRWRTTSSSGLPRSSRHGPRAWRRRVRVISAIAVSVFRESVRDRVLVQPRSLCRRC